MWVWDSISASSQNSQQHLLDQLPPVLSAMTWWAQPNLSTLNSTQLLQDCEMHRYNYAQSIDTMTPNISDNKHNSGNANKTFSPPTPTTVYNSNKAERSDSKQQWSWTKHLTLNILHHLYRFLMPGSQWCMQPAYDGMQTAHGCIQATCIRKWGQLHSITVCHCRRRYRKHGIDAVHPGINALHAACITIVKYTVNEHISSQRTFLFLSLWIGKLQTACIPSGAPLNTAKLAVYKTHLHTTKY